MDYVSLVPVLVKAIQEQQGALSQKDNEIVRLTALEQMMERWAGIQSQSRRSRARMR
jgi:hypothetical protein